ncbi:O-antigen ligase [Falsiroseomonas sp.]|uniref:O-antigen ligase family protein n=1 Tax=Falsiroseomonas sp. TaxID=2870721 RepID=UPI0027327F94|nr:O-antigen ligase family protein [Falsiroseomonas sp.]MDP3415505.1 O-antigen ligase family protein [Falsiroseomonas sp.]
MRPSLAVLPAGVGAALFGASALAGPLIAVGAVLGLALAAVVYAVPGIGLALMVLAGTALQVLGSEHISGLPFSLGKLAGALTLAVWITRSILHRLPVTWSPQIPALAGFLAMVLISAVTAPAHFGGMEGLARYIQLVLLTVMIANIAGESARALIHACIALTACMTLSSLIGLAEFLLPNLAIESDDPSLVQGNIGAIIDRDSLDGVEVKRITGGLSDSNWFGYMLVAVLPVNLFLFMRFAAPVARLLILAAAGLQSVGVVLSFTRSAVIALAISVVYLLIRGRLPLKPLLLAGLLGGIGFALWNPAGLERLYSVQYIQEGSTPLRSWLLRGGAALVLERPIAGYGYNQYGPNFMGWLDTRPDVPEDVRLWQANIERRVASGEDRLEWIMPHNTVVQVWVEFGLFGMVAFGGIIFFMFRDLAVARRHGGPAWGLLADCLVASLLGFLICAAFGHLALAKTVWILAGYSAALRRVALEHGPRGAELRR